MKVCCLRKQEINALGRRTDIRSLESLGSVLYDRPMRAPNTAQNFHLVVFFFQTHLKPHALKIFGQMSKTES